MLQALLINAAITLIAGIVAVIVGLLIYHHYIVKFWEVAPLP